MMKRKINKGIGLGRWWSGDRAATPETLMQLPPQRTVKLWRAFRFVGHRLLNWRHSYPGRWGGSNGAGEDSAIPEAAGVLSSQSIMAEATTRKDFGYQMVRLAVALTLLTAAALKGYDLSTGPVAGNGLLDSRWFLIGVVEMEILFGLWLLANIWPKLTWMVALGCFSAFTCVSLYKALSGYASCGCFGRVQVNPWYTATLDLGIVGCLLRWRPTGSPSSLQPGEGQSEDRWRLPPFSPAILLNVIKNLRVVGVLMAWLVVGLPVAHTMSIYTPTTALSDTGDIMDSGKVVVLEPEKWIGRRFPLLDYIDIGDKLKEGDWLVLLYHQDCPVCLEVIRDLQRIIRRFGIQQVAALEIPPRTRLNAIVSIPEGVVNGLLTPAQDWFVQTPIILTLSKGQVTLVRNTGHIL